MITAKMLQELGKPTMTPEEFIKELKKVHAAALSEGVQDLDPKVVKRLKYALEEALEHIDEILKDRQKFSQLNVTTFLIKSAKIAENSLACKYCKEHTPEEYAACNLASKRIHLKIEKEKENDAFKESDTRPIS